MCEADVPKILAQLLPIPCKDLHIVRLCHEEDKEPYDVWRIDAGEKSWILKKAKEYEHEVYTTFFVPHRPQVPQLEGAVAWEQDFYLLESYIPGHNLQKASREDLKIALDALIALQAAYWENTELAQRCYSFEKSLPDRQRRGQYLNHPVLEQAYRMYLKAYETVPRTLCHDDLLPLNVLIHQRQAYLIDWEYAGILPYPTSLVRLLAHGTPQPDDFFVLSQEDRQFGTDYYYNNLIREKGISYQDYRRTLSLFFFYEFCEWVYVGNRYGTTDGAYYQRYMPIALRQAERLTATASQKVEIPRKTKSEDARI